MDVYRYVSLFVFLNVNLATSRAHPVLSGRLNERDAKVSIFKGLPPGSFPFVLYRPMSICLSKLDTAVLPRSE